MTERDSAFWASVDGLGTEGCWVWSGAVNNKGYGGFYDGSRTVMAHRHAYEVTHGPIPSGLQIDHLCRVRRCVNPRHLEAVTQSVNLRRRGGRDENETPSRCPQGHAYDEENTFVRKRDGTWLCRICRRDDLRRHRAKRAEAA